MKWSHSDIYWFAAYLNNSHSVLLFVVFQKFIRDPYTTTLGGFSKVTKFLNDTFMTVEGMERHKEGLAEDILHEDIEGMDINAQEEPGFEMITRVSEINTHWHMV